MELLFNQYSLQLHVEDYKKIMLGLLIFQEVAIGELAHIRAKDIKLQEGKIKLREYALTHKEILAQLAKL